eukprot:TRINITY_DN1606_c0_g4_i2.p1 TRINITY_DN1606_c0_g4~~TRINITY_DN1606_c0_g4_i2.p1  ORF type:complete len:269 (+),score=65.32 TRINITY_DN1606_c0_g4_i2:36-842(+)
MDDEISLRQFNLVRLSRDTVLKWMHDEDFAPVIPNLFCRVVVRDQSSAKQYRAMRAIRLGDDLQKPQMELAYGPSVRQYSLEFVSNGPFTEDEFQQYKQTQESNGLALPSQHDINEKVSCMREFLERKQKPEMKKRRAEEEKERRVPAKRKKVSYTAENEQLSKKIASLNEKCSMQDRQMDELQKDLDRLEREVEKKRAETEILDTNLTNEEESQEQFKTKINEMSSVISEQSKLVLQLQKQLQGERDLQLLLATKRKQILEKYRNSE